MRRFFATCLLLLYPMYCVAEDVLTAEFPDHLGHVRVSLCFAGQAADYLYRHEQAAAFANGIYHEGNN